MTLFSKRLAFALVLLAACGGDDNDSNADDGTSSGSESDTGAGPSTGSPTTDPDADSSSDGDPTLTSVTDADSGSTETTASTTDADGSTGSDGSDTSAANVCEPDAADNECYACEKENCCDALTMCVEADANCPCVLECMSAIDDPGPSDANTCADMCDAEYTAIVPPLMMLATCRAEMCGGNNGCGGG